ncbi:hypothetical protein ON010_g8805 [Phytophthora cinnamomi]|nr:hypothetical protein ON010_g8805 [Phytophthora cinnamomi]
MLVPRQFIDRTSPRHYSTGTTAMSRMRDEEDEELDESFQHADIPNTFRELRACMTCSLIKTFTQFYDTGCENCAFLQMADNRQRVAECTSAYFEGPFDSGDLCCISIGGAAGLDQEVLGRQKHPLPCAELGDLARRLKRLLQPATVKLEVRHQSKAVVRRLQVNQDSVVTWMTPS